MTDKSENPIQTSIAVLDHFETRDSNRYAEFDIIKPKTGDSFGSASAYIEAEELPESAGQADTFHIEHDIETDQIVEIESLEDGTLKIELYLSRIEDTVAEFYPVDKADNPGYTSMWCFEEMLPDTYVSNGVFMAEVAPNEMRVRELEYLPDRTEEFKIKTARMQLKAEEKVKESGDFPTRDDN